MKISIRRGNILVPIVISIWLVALLEVYRQLNSSGLELEVTFISIVLIFPFLPKIGIITDFSGLSSNVLLFLWVAIVLSMVLNPADSAQIVYGVNVSILFYLALALKKQPSSLRLVCKVYSILGAIWITAKTYNAEYLDGRLFANQIHPNWWGNMAFGIAIAGLNWDTKWIQLIPISVGLYISILASSRASIVSILAGVSVFYVMRLKSRIITGKGLFIAFLFIFIAFTASLIWWRDLTAFANEVFLLDSSDRGMGSGLTGRTELWQESLTRWFKSPVFGNGYKTNPEAHNALLMMLSETGLIGASGWCLLWVLVVLRTLSYRYKNDECNPAFTAIIGSYFLSGVTHPTAININPTSVLFVICVARYLDVKFYDRLAGTQRLIVAN